jgi:hypothetical protein
MTATLIAILTLVVIGLPAVLAIDRRARGASLVGLAFLYGNGIVFFVLLALSVIGIGWTLVSVAVAAVVVFVALSVLAGRRAGGGPAGGPPALHFVDLLTLFVLVGYGFYATLAPLWEWDFWAIWGLKARVFFERGGIDWRFLESHWNVFNHVDYPLLVPFNFDFVALLNGGWSDRWLGLLFVAWAAALLLIIRDLAADDLPRLFAALVTLAVATLAVSRYVGLAEGPVIAFGAGALLFLRRALLHDDDAAWTHGAILLGLAANTKNEGIALAIAVVIALLILRPRAVIRLWPAAVIAAPWLLLRATHVLPTDIVGGSVLVRVMGRAPYLVQIAQFLWQNLYERWFWVAVVAGIAVAHAAARKREAFVLIVTAIQLGFYVGSYLATPHDARWHILTSWPRLSMQIALPITFATLVMLAATFLVAPQSPPDAEARPVE